jgi:hypothetical protein
MGESCLRLSALGSACPCSALTLCLCLALPPLPSLPPAQIVGLIVIGILIIVDAMFSNDRDFIFEPSVTNYARTQARRNQ